MIKENIFSSGFCPVGVLCIAMLFILAKETASPLEKWVSSIGLLIISMMSVLLATMISLLRN